MERDRDVVADQETDGRGSNAVSAATLAGMPSYRSLGTAQGECPPPALTGPFEGPRLAPAESPRGSQPRWGSRRLGFASVVLVFLLGIPSTQARVLPGTHESVLHDGVRQVVTDGRATLFMDLGATQVELRLGPDTREVPAVLLWTPGGGRVVYSLRELAPDVPLRRETHVGVAWMARYVVDRPRRTLLLAVDNLMDRLLSGASQDTGVTWVALSLDTGARMAVDGDLILQTHSPPSTVAPPSPRTCVASPPAWIDSRRGPPPPPSRANSCSSRAGPTLSPPARPRPNCSPELEGRRRAGLSSRSPVAAGSATGPLPWRASLSCLREACCP